MKHSDATHLENTLASACPTTQHAAIIMAERDQLGRQRYGQDVDENPLTAAQWAQHAVEEAADGLKYAIRAREEARKLEIEVEALRTANAALVEALEALEVWGDELDGNVSPPDRNCSCHISPPCSDCVEFSGQREAKQGWEGAKTKARATLAKNKTQP